jgi:hypothetical protein
MRGTVEPRTGRLRVIRAVSGNRAAVDDRVKGVEVQLMAKGKDSKKEAKKPKKEAAPKPKK